MSESTAREIEGLFARALPSELQPGVSYELTRVVGAGGFAIACLATRHGPSGDSQVVLKVTRPRIAAEAGQLATRAVKKEAVALGRLNEQVPPSPFVVRLVDTGTFNYAYGGQTLTLPWVAVEYVHGGAEGTTLKARVRYATQHTGYAFYPARAARALLHLAAGLTEIHAAGVVHRDITPGNVLCCGFGESELFKISDFGIARPAGITSTFGDVTLGTPGYVAPEQVHMRSEIGPWTDVFSLSTVMFYMFTGQKYFPQASPMEAVLAAQRPERRRLLDAPALCPELRAQPGPCAVIDGILARASAVDPRDRYQSIREFAANLLEPLRDTGDIARPSQRHVDSVTARPTPQRSDWVWQRRSASLNGPVVSDVAWESDAHCLAVTDAGLMFWEGTGWIQAPTLGLPIHQVCRSRAGDWLCAAEGGTLHQLSHGRFERVTSCPLPGVELVSMDGDPRDLAVIVGRDPAGALSAFPVAALRWFKPCPLNGLASLNGVCRMDDESWLLVGSNPAGRAAASLYRPMKYELSALEVPVTRALLCCAAQPSRGAAIAAGTDAWAIDCTGSEAPQQLAEASVLSAAAVDVLGQRWLAGPGSLWLGTGCGWSRAYHDDAWTAPVIALFADVDVVVAIAADGSVVDGRAPELDPTAVI